MRSKPAGRSGTATPFTAPSILFVDDNPQLLSLFDALLASTGYCITVCNGPSTAISLASTTHFDVLVADFDMPTMNGLGLASALCAGNLSLGVVLMSAAPDELPTGYIARRGWTLINKPIDPVSLVRAVHNQFRRPQIARQIVGRSTAPPFPKTVGFDRNVLARLGRIA